MRLTHTPFVPAKAGIQGRTLLLAILGPRFRRGRTGNGDWFKLIGNWPKG
jgi:hypothetical protein